jgi:cytochrome c oxidase subunit 2
MYTGATLVTLLVSTLMLVPFLRRRARRAHYSLFLWGGVALSSLTLTVLIPCVLTSGGEMRAPILSPHLTVDVTGSRY